MKTRRLCAVIAAAATLLGGMAFGTAGAYAAGSASIEVRHSQKGHTYSAYKFASLTVDGDAVQVDTDADWVTAVTDAVAAANNNMDPVVSMPSEYDSNPAAFAATKTGDNDAAWFRTFAASLAVSDGVVADKTVAGNGGTAAIGSLEEGWYLITDVDKDGGRGTNAIVATTLNGVAATFKVKGDPATGQGKINAVGMFVAKNESDCGLASQTRIANTHRKRASQARITNRIASRTGEWHDGGHSTAVRWKGAAARQAEREHHVQRWGSVQSGRSRISALAAGGGRSDVATHHLHGIVQTQLHAPVPCGRIAGRTVPRSRTRPIADRL